MREFQTILEAQSAREPWTIEGALDGVAVLYGDSGIGKTFVACSIAASVSSGRPWLGRRTNRGPVVYIAGEGGEETLAYRLQAAFDNLQCCEWIEENVKVYVHGPGLNLVAGPQELMRQIDGTGVRPELIVIDTLSRAFIGDENKQEDMGGFVRSLDLLRAKYGSTVLVIHHTNKEKGIRGSSVLGGAVDVQLRMEHDKTAGEHHFKITAEKLRERDAGDFACKLRFGLVPMWTYAGFEDEMALLRDECDGEVITTRVVELPQDVVSRMQLISEVGKKLAAKSNFTFLEWFNAAKAQPQGRTINKTIFKGIVPKLLASPGIYGIDKVAPGIFSAALDKPQEEA